MSAENRTAISSFGIACRAARAGIIPSIPWMISGLIPADFYRHAAALPLVRPATRRNVMQGALASGCCLAGPKHSSFLPFIRMMRTASTCARDKAIEAP
jgi:hypothetical protein